MLIPSKRHYSLSKVHNLLKQAYPTFNSIIKVERIPSFISFKKYCERNNIIGRHFYLEQGLAILFEILENDGVKLSSKKKSEILLRVQNPKGFKRKKRQNTQNQLTKIQEKVKRQNENLKKRDMNGLLGKAEIRPKDYLDKDWGNYSVRPVKKR